MAGFSLDIAVDTAGLDKMASGLVAKLERIVARNAFKVERAAKQLAPVDTGVLRASIRTNLQGLEAEIGSSVEYAVYQEYGFVHKGSGAFIIHPFITPAIAAQSGPFLAEVAAAVDGA